MGAAIAATLLYLVILRGSSDPGERVTGNRVAVTLSEFKIVPQSINVKQGNLQLIVTNKGKQIHNLQIESIVDPASDAQPTILLRVPAMQPGQTKESPAGGATLPPGKYVWRSSISNDDDLGMYGNVEVRQ